MREDFNLVDLVKLIWSRKWLILLTCFAVGVVSIIASLSLDNYYQSETTFIPAGEDNFKPEKIFGPGVDYIYGGREDLDRLLSMAQSGEIKNFLIDSFNLYEVYDIDPANPKAELKVKQTLNGLLSVTKTKYGAVAVAVEDKDPLRASQMANATRVKTRQNLQEMIKAQLRSSMQTLRSDLETRSLLVQNLQDSLMYWRSKYGIYDTEGQAEILSTLVSEAESKYKRESARLQALRKSGAMSADTLAMIAASVKGLEEQLSGLTDPKSTARFTLSKFNAGKEKIMATEGRIEIENKQISYQKMKLSQYEAAINSSFNVLFVLEEAKVPYEKSRPKRSILVMGATFFAFVLIVLYVLISDRLRQVDWS